MTASVSQYKKKQVYYHNKQEKMARVKLVT